MLWTAALLAGAIGVNLVGIRIAGGVEGWQGWLHAHATSFFAWRLLLYAGTAAGWCWMRRRLLTREPDAVAVQRLWRAEAAAVVAIVALEVGVAKPFG